MVTGAGTGSSGNVIRALRAIAPTPFIAGVHHDRFTLSQATALTDATYLVPPPTARGFAAAVGDIVRREGINVVMPTEEDAVRALSDQRARVPIPLFLPGRRTIAVCQDKYVLTTRLRARKVPAPVTYAVRSIGDVARIFRRFPKNAVLWCRARRGSR